MNTRHVLCAERPTAKLCYGRRCDAQARDIESPCIRIHPSAWGLFPETIGSLMNTRHVLCPEPPNCPTHSSAVRLDHH
eukprot:6387862-Heterocapsa_arctica.AAC.1